MKIRLYDVGRNHDETTFEVVGEPDPDTVAELLVEHARQFLISSNVGATWDKEDCTGTVYAGFHVVGRAVRVG